MLASLPFPEIAPEIFSIDLFGVEFALRWYALAYIAGIVIGWRIALSALARPALWPADTAPMGRERFDDLATWVILGVILGGRLGYVLFYQPGHFMENPLEILMIWQGGMSFHGGLLGVVAACVLHSLRHGHPWLSVADLLCMVAPVGLLLGRIANFINNELWGRPTDLPWGVVFPGPMAQDCAGVTGLCARHPSQLYEAALEGLVLGTVLLWLAWRRGALRRKGLITGLFFAGYGLSRFAVEFVRQPDPQFVTPGNPLGLALHAEGVGLTMGQLLSVPMILFGLAVAWHASRAARRHA